MSLSQKLLHLVKWYPQIHLQRPNHQQVKRLQQKINLSQLQQRPKRHRRTHQLMLQRIHQQSLLQRLVKKFPQNHQRETPPLLPKSLR
jgi:hypothetical protein